jgi:hypothetical protein
MNFIVRLLVWFGIACEIKRGTKRVTLVFPEHDFALKFAIFQPIYFLKWFLFYMYKRDLSTFKMMMFRVSGRSAKFPGNMVGIIENWREYQFFKSNRQQPFLLPTHFSLLGFCNVMPLKVDVPPNINLFRVFETETPVNWDRHHFSNPDNFCFYCDHLCMSDYGSSLTQEIIQKYNFLPHLTGEYVSRYAKD